MQLAAGCDATIRPSSAGNLNLKLGAPRSSVNGIKSVRLAKLQDSRALACVARDMRGAVPPRIISLARIPGTKLLLVGTVTAAAVRHGKERRRTAASFLCRTRLITEASRKGAVKQHLA